MVLFCSSGFIGCHIHGVKKKWSNWQRWGMVITMLREVLTVDSVSIGCPLYDTGVPGGTGSGGGGGGKRGTNAVIWAGHWQRVGRGAADP